jgi:hypothetical protein
VTFIAAVSATASSAIGSAADGAAKSTTPNDVQAGVLGFLVVAAIGVALVFLLRSMNKQFKKIGPKPTEPDDALDAVDEHPVSSQAAPGPVAPAHVVPGEVVAEPDADVAPAAREANATDNPSR